LLAPVLGAQYGEELKNGKLALAFDDDGTFAIWAYGEHKLPICPLTYPTILGHDSEALDRMSDKFLDLPNWRPQIAERALGLKAELADLARGDAETRREIDERVAAVNRDWHGIDRLISAQFWRVAFFRVAEDEINYRRFFNINDLAGLRMELALVFAHAHARALRMLKAREIDGLRIDHIDGLFDPKAYLTALREHAGTTAARRSPPNVVGGRDRGMQGGTRVDPPPVGGVGCGRTRAPGGGRGARAAARRRGRGGRRRRGGRRD